MTEDDTADLLVDSAQDGDPAFPLVFARVLDGQGGCRPLNWAEVQAWQPATKGEVLWAHLTRSRPGADGWLAKLGISRPTRELLTSDETRPRAFREGEALVATLRGINFNPGAEPEDMLSLQLWCDGTRLITLRGVALQTPRHVLKMLDRDELGPVDCGELITELAEAMITRMNRAIVDMNDEIDRLEAIDPARYNDATLMQIAAIRRNCLGLKRHMGPMHEALEDMSRVNLPWFEEHDRREVHESIDRLKRYLDDIDSSKESALVLHDEIRARAVQHTQRTSYLLTVVATIFMPLTFLTGLLGSNVAGIPYAAEPWAFWGVVGVCGAIIAVLVVLFARWKWL